MAVRSGTPTPSATSNTAGALIAAAQRFYVVLEQASRTPATGAGDVERLLHQDCECRRIVQFLRDQAAQGRHIERPVDVLDPRVAHQTATTGTVFLTLKQAAGRVVDENGHVVEQLEPSTNAVVLDFADVQGELLITQLASDAS